VFDWSIAEISNEGMTLYFKFIDDRWHVDSFNTDKIQILFQNTRIYSKTKFDYSIPEGYFVSAYLTPQTTDDTFTIPYNLVESIGKYFILLSVLSSIVMPNLSLQPVWSFLNAV
jgi:sporulation protein YlmC with PRC-barrel domain